MKPSQYDLLHGTLTFWAGAEGEKILDPPNGLDLFTEKDGKRQGYFICTEEKPFAPGMFQYSRDICHTITVFCDEKLADAAFVAALPPTVGIAVLTRSELGAQIRVLREAQKE